MNSRTYYYEQLRSEASTAKDNIEGFAYDLKRNITKASGPDFVSVLLSSSIAGLVAYITKSPEPIFQAGVMGISQIVSSSLHQTLLDLGYLNHVPNSIMTPVHKSLISTGLFSLINYQFHIERNLYSSATNGLISSGIANFASNMLSPMC